MDGDAVLAQVNSDSHVIALAQLKRQVPDFVGWANLELERPVYGAAGELTGGSLVITTPESYYPTAHCRKEALPAALPAPQVPAKPLHIIHFTVSPGLHEFPGRFYQQPCEC